MKKRFDMTGRLDESYEQNKRTSQFITFLKQMDENQKWYNPKNKGKYIIDIIPYIVETDDHPKTKKGEYDFNLIIYVHYGIGAEEGSYLCPSTFGKSCPICEEHIRLRNSGVDKEEADKFKAKKRVIYNVLDHEDNEVKIFNVSYPIFEELWQSERLDSKGEEGVVNPIYSEGESSLRFRVTANKGIGKFINFKFIPIEKIDESIFDKAISLEKLLVHTDYDELKKIMEGGEQEEKTEEEDDYIEAVEKMNKKEEKKEEMTGCPSGHEFGKDFDKHEECDDCEKTIYENCLKVKTGG